MAFASVKENLRKEDERFSKHKYKHCTVFLGMGISDVERVLKKYNVKPKDFLGQNFLIDERIIKREVEYADLNKNDVVLEVGAGVGNLTEELLKKAGKVIAVEKDRRLAEILKDRFGGENIRIITSDILKIRLPKFNKVVSNIPYLISSPLTFKLLKENFELGVMSYQKEFAERLAAKPGEKNYSRISAATYYHAEVELLETVPKTAFYPSPKVDSAVVRIKPKKPPFEVNEAKFFNFVHAVFTQKKKTLKNALKLSSHLLKFKIEEEKIPKELLEKRVFQLSPEEIAEICNLF